ncbi:hypothetical protein KUTeg_013178 [Tegillarca granosa]|uniref:G-protein coupled receptors family 1 profile domain-containing protein n=1 Tax=Tegillarca granosa TaxID=220873 RepID=A0ABQ9ESY7_TEGGR|nr:hypothetical protein KUTeg_013178 [Tegillarca granosa]
MSSVDFKIDNQGNEQINLKEDRQIPPMTMFISDLTLTNRKKLRKCVSLEESEMLAVKKGLKPISYNSSEMSKKPFLRQSSSSSVRSFKRQNSVKDKARIGRSNAIFVSITVVFILSYIPFFALEILRRTNVLTLETSLGYKSVRNCKKKQEGNAKDDL